MEVQDKLHMEYQLDFIRMFVDVWWIVDGYVDVGLSVGLEILRYLKRYLMDLSRRCLVNTLCRLMTFSTAIATILLMKLLSF